MTIVATCSSCRGLMVQSSSAEGRNYQCPYCISRRPLLSYDFLDNEKQPPQAPNKRQKPPKKHRAKYCHSSTEEDKEWVAKRKDAYKRRILGIASQSDKKNEKDDNKNPVTYSGSQENHSTSTDKDELLETHNEQLKPGLLDIQDDQLDLFLKIIEWLIDR